jgi:cytochrome P450
MRSLLPADQIASVPVSELAISSAPERWHGPLRELGTHCRDGACVVVGPRDVPVALAAPSLTAAPPPSQADQAVPSGPAAQLLARMARFSDGHDHRKRRELLVSMLPPVPRVTKAAGARTNYYLRRRLATFDIMPMARQLPAEVLAMAIGLPPGDAERAAALTGVLCDAVTPTLVPRPGTGSGGDTAAEALIALMAGLGGGDQERVTAAISILFQARDATAGLIGTAVLAGARTAASSSVPQRVEDVLRREGPVQCTRRTAVIATQIGDSMVPAGAALWIFLATAERGTGVPATFGSGPHGCPGPAHAYAIARQVVTVLEAEGWRPVHGQRTELEPRPNVRVPGRVMVTRS